MSGELFTPLPPDDWDQLRKLGSQIHRLSPALRQQGQIHRRSPQESKALLGFLDASARLIGSILAADARAEKQRSEEHDRLQAELDRAARCWGRKRRRGSSDRGVRNSGGEKMEISP